MGHEIDEKLRIDPEWLLEARVPRVGHRTVLHITYSIIPRTSIKT